MCVTDLEITLVQTVREGERKSDEHCDSSFIVVKMALKRNVNPQLEALRNEIEGPPNLEVEIINIQKLTSKIHAAYLFEKEGISVLQKICLLVSSTPTGKIYSGWQDFGAHLGLSREQLQCIEYDFKGLQDPTYYVLLTFVQCVDATMDKLLIALQKMKRLDVINRLAEPLMLFVNNYDIDSELNGVLQPKYLPRVPLVLRPIIPIENTQSSPEDKLSSANTNSTTDLNDHENKKKNQNYGSIVMLTFTEDGQKTVNNIAKIFREQDPKVGVLMLQEQEKFVYSRAEEFVDDCFKQVDYIVPILTKGYINRINNSINNFYKSGEDSLDSKYLNYIHSLLRFEYVKNKCCNNRVRCIVPDNEIQTVIKSDLHPTLQAWFRESDINDFVKNILLKKF